ncbi:MAG TPA: hypothetical protein VF506_09480, partial [Streptosporangiaceae bacterium]
SPAGCCADTDGAASVSLLQERHPRCGDTDAPICPSMIFEFRLRVRSVLVASSFPGIWITTTNLEPDDAAELAAAISEIVVGSTATYAG